jgi:hypothetical protein
MPYRENGQLSILSQRFPVSLPKVTAIQDEKGLVKYDFPLCSRFTLSLVSENGSARKISYA